MKLKDFLASSFFLKCIFSLSLFILIFISSVSYRHTTAITESTEALVHSHNVRNELEVLISYIKDAETGQRGFMISRDSSFLIPYTGARKNAERSLFALRKLAAHNLKQQNNIDTLSRITSLKFFYLAKSLQLSTFLPLTDSMVVKSFAQGEIVMDSIRAHINRMSGLELVYLKEKQKKLDNYISFTPLFTLILLLFSIIIFVIAYIKISNDLSKSEETNARLKLNIASIKHAENIGNFSTWEWNLEANIFNFSDTQYALLGIAPNSIVPSIENFLKFVHPNDRHIIAHIAREVHKDNRASPAFFRVIRSDGVIRYFHFIGKIITDPAGKRVLIGINSDVTDQHKKDLSLQERNYELEQSNKELESFNYVASHDLQEPLRIIQLYISRISEKEQHTLTPNVKEYFDRIKLSASRMQILINDLLLFSRTNRTENTFEQSDLNDLLQNAKDHLAQAIEEKKGIITSDVLPTLMVIPYQIQQLFINLLSNSLKYCRPGIAPVIKITCKPVVLADYPQLKSDSKRVFFKVSVQDNGLGFEQEFSEKIFELFKRLHNKNEYPGTGIGLSICQKIADNHSGYIMAKGNPGEGAVFSIFLP